MDAGLPAPGFTLLDSAPVEVWDMFGKGGMGPVAPWVEFWLQSPFSLPKCPLYQRNCKYQLVFRTSVAVNPFLRAYTVPRDGHQNRVWSCWLCPHRLCPLPQSPVAYFPGGDPTQYDCYQGGFQPDSAYHLHSAGEWSSVPVSALEVSPSYHHR